MKPKTKRTLEKHQNKLKCLKIQRKKINHKIHHEIKIIERLSNPKIQHYIEQQKRDTGVNISVVSLMGYLCLVGAIRATDLEDSIG